MTTKRPLVLAALGLAVTVPIVVGVVASTAASDASGRSYSPGNFVVVPMAQKAWPAENFPVVPAAQKRLSQSNF